MRIMNLIFEQGKLIEEKQFLCSGSETRLGAQIIDSCTVRSCENSEVQPSMMRGTTERHAEIKSVL